ncbi:hypothetical protein M8C13_04475 [Crossiella sp. SN42]|uniref:hypothetical protein n=1 Tax=Crossiella sp. SN42 TaxID=2944808 RepID=UPI00207C21F5|nr:hypothetical protein [Crossiella sp. SN42]MCO1575014.1 hypothetical protein [Crossiella sp. SN42]
MRLLHNPEPRPATLAELDAALHQAETEMNRALEHRDWRRATKARQAQIRLAIARANLVDQLIADAAKG